MERDRMPDVKLSIIVPCYKAERYLPKCLNSLMGQTLQDIEIVAINDGSPDRCLNILQEWQERYPQKIQIIDKQNEGMWHARWDGIKVARGEYIGFLDSDDYAEPNFAELMYAAAKESKADIVVCGFSRTDLESGRILSQEMSEPRPEFSPTEEPGRILEINGAQWNKIFRASVLKNLHALSVTPPVLEDLLFQLLVYLQMRGSIAFVPKSLIHYMVHQGSIIKSVSEEQVDETFAAFVETRNLYEAAGSDIALLQAIDATAFLHVGISLNYRLSYTDCNLSRAVRRSKLFLDEYFPLWRNSPYICGRYARLHGSTYRRLLISSRMFRLGLMVPFLTTYRIVTDLAQFDIKW